MSKPPEKRLKTALTATFINSGSLTNQTTQLSASQGRNLGKYHAPYNNTMYRRCINSRKHTLITEEQVRFFGYLSPFSNFHKASFWLDNTLYICVEQAFTAHRARRHNDEHRFLKIMRESHPVQMKRLARCYRPQCDDERAGEDKLMQAAVMQKFLQNTTLAHALLKTGKRQMLECNPYDTYWSTGLCSTDERLACGSYPGRNRLGEILESVRAQLKAQC